MVKLLVDYPEDVFDKVMSVNVKGMWLGNKYVLPHMNDGGSIIMTSSVAGLLGSPNVSIHHKQTRCRRNHASNCRGSCTEKN